MSSVGLDDVSIKTITYIPDINNYLLLFQSSFNFETDQWIYQKLGFRMFIFSDDIGFKSILNILIHCSLDTGLQTFGYTKLRNQNCWNEM